MNHDGNHYVVDIDAAERTTRLVNAKTRNGALQHVAQGVITVRLASARDMYEAAQKGLEIEDAITPVVIP